MVGPQRLMVGPGAPVGPSVATPLSAMHKVANYNGPFHLTLEGIKLC